MIVYEDLDTVFLSFLLLSDDLQSDSFKCDKTTYEPISVSLIS